MSNSVVKVTETPVTESLVLIIAEDGTVTPDKKTVEAYLNSRPGETELQIMQVNKSDGKNIDVTVDTVTYLASHNEEGNIYHHTPEEMDEIERNLINFRMDHDYTPLTSPRRPSPVEEVAEIDELAQTLSILEGSNIINEQPAPEPSPPKIIKTIAKSPRRIVNLNTQIINKSKVKTITQSNLIFKQPNKTPVKTKSVKQKPLEEEVEEEEEENYSDEDFALESEESEDDANDSDFEIDESPRAKTAKKITRTPRSRIQSEPTLDSQKAVKTPKTSKPVPSRQNSQTKLETEPPKVEKPPETNTENKVPEKKPIPKKEKKTPKPIPDDFALFSTPDIIRRVGGKQDGTTPTTPTTPVLPESPKSQKPAKIFQGTPRSVAERSSLDSKEKRLSTDGKSHSIEKDNTNKHPVHRLSTSSEPKSKDRRLSLDVKSNRHSLDSKTDISNMDKTPESKKMQHVSSTSSSKNDSHVTLQSIDESTGGNSNESSLMEDNQLEPMPSAEDIRAIIQNQDTKTFTTSLVIPEPEQPSEQPHVDQSHINLETAGLDLDQSILDNINSDLISEDILYQVAQSLVDNAEFQNAIDKSLVDENLVLDPSVQQSMTQDHDMTLQQSHSSLNQVPMETSPPTVKGTQIMRSGGRVVVIPPIERPTTRSRNKKKQESEPVKLAVKPVSKLLDDEHVSGGELDSSSDDDKSDDDPDKLWCICNQPHNNRFMICCDTCEEWYHGKCVNVTKAMGQMMEQEGREWICLYCKVKDSSLKRPAAAARRVRKASRTSGSDITNSEKKAESTSSVESSSSVPGCLVCGKPCRTNSIYCSDPCILKHAKVVEKVVVFERSSGTIYSGSSAPTAANLDKWLQQHPGFEVVRSTNANKPVTTKQLTQSKLKLVKNPPSQGGISLALQRKGVNVNILRHSPKQPPSAHQKGQNKQQITGFKIVSKQVATPPRTKLIQPAPVVRTPSAIASSKPKVVQTTLKPTPQQPTKDKPMPQKTPKSRQAEEAAPQTNKQENIRDNVKKTLLEQLTNRLKLADDIKVSKEEVTKISNEIESQLYKCFGDTGQKYRNKYRSLIFNIKDIKNQTLWRRICEKSTNPYQLVRLSPDDLASQELALWRERENKHQLDMITKSELEQLGRNRQFVFKTHKGEQVLEDSRPTDSVDNTEVVMGLGTNDSVSSESPTSDSKKETKEKDKKSTKHSRSERDRNRDRKSSKEKEKIDRKDRKTEHLSSSRDRSHRKRSRSKDHHSEKHRSRSRDKDRHRRSSHKSSKHRRDSHNSTEKLDKKSKEILEQLVDNKIVPPLEDRLWKHVQQEDITTAPVAESDSDHEPTSTVTIPTPPRTGDSEEPETTPISTNDVTEMKDENADDDDDKAVLGKEVSQVTPSFIDDDDGSSSPPPRTQADYIWKGTINMVDVAQISITAHEVSGDCGGLGEELPPCLDVVGRISPDTVWDYIGKMKCSNSKAISLLRLNATNMEEKMPYIALYSYLSSRNRLGVVKSGNKAVKDFYILPLASQTPIPQSLLPLNGPGFEESRPALLLGIIVRDKRKRPLFAATTPVANKRSKTEVPITPVTPTTPVVQPTTPSRSYTPPPTSDPRLKQPSAAPKPVLQDSPKEEMEIEMEMDEDMDEPYSPGDSDPETIPTASEENSKTSTHLNATDLSNLLTGSVKSSSFLETGLTAQTFEPFSNKFDTIPGLDESAALPANSVEIQRKMEELDQRIAMQKAEIDNMSQDIASSATTGIGTSALASIALPSNLQQILDSIKGINASNPTEAEAQTTKKESKSSAAANPDLTIPLMLPKISARSLTGSAATAASSPTIPLNLPKPKSKFSSINSPKVTEPVPQNTGNKTDKSASVLSSLSEEDLIRKAAEMLGETDDSIAAKANTKEVASSNKPGLPTSFSSGPVMYTPPPNLVPPSPLLGTTPFSSVTSKGAQLDINQPPIPGLDD